MDRYVIRCLDCLMFGTPIPPDTTCGNCSSRATEKWVAPEVVESLRRKLVEHGPCHGPEDCPEAGLREEITALRRELANVKRDAESDEAQLLKIYKALDGLPTTGERTSPKSVKHLSAWDRIRALREQLAARDATICGMREALGRACDSLGTAEAHAPFNELPGSYDMNALSDGRKALSEAPTCPHKEEVERLKNMLTAEYKKERILAGEELAQELADQIASLQAELAASQEEADKLRNLAFANGKVWFELITQMKAIPGSAEYNANRYDTDLDYVVHIWSVKTQQSYDIRVPNSVKMPDIKNTIDDLQAELASLREVARAVKAIECPGCEIGEKFDGDDHKSNYDGPHVCWRGGRAVVEALSSHESKYGKVER